MKLLGGLGRSKKLLIAQRVSLGLLFNNRYLLLGYRWLRCRRRNLGHSLLARLYSFILRLERLNLLLELIELRVLLEYF